MTKHFKCCSSASFLYLDHAGKAVSTVAIPYYRDLERTVASSHARNRKYSEEKDFSKRARECGGDIADRIECYRAPLKRALFREFPKITVNKSVDDKKKESKRSSHLAEHLQVRELDLSLV